MGFSQNPIPSATEILPGQPPQNLKKKGTLPPYHAAAGGVFTNGGMDFRSRMHSFHAGCYTAQHAWPAHCSWFWWPYCNGAAGDRDQRFLALCRRSIVGKSGRKVHSKPRFSNDHVRHPVSDVKGSSSTKGPLPPRVLFHKGLTTLEHNKGPVHQGPLQEKGPPAFQGPVHQICRHGIFHSLREPRISLGSSGPSARSGEGRFPSALSLVRGRPDMHLAARIVGPKNFIPHLPQG